MLEPPLLRGRRDAREDLQAPVDLQRVGRDGDGAPPARTQAVGHGEGDVGLPHAGGAEEGEDGPVAAGALPADLAAAGAHPAEYGQPAWPSASGAGSPRAPTHVRPRSPRRPSPGTGSTAGTPMPSPCSARGATSRRPETTLEAVAAALAPAALVGCGAGGVLGGGREVEGGTGVAVWAATLDGGLAEAFWAETVEAPGGVSVTGLPDLDGAAAVILLPDPRGFPTDPVLGELGRRAPGVPVLGGLASARGQRWRACRCSSTTRSSRAAPWACASTGSRCCPASRRAPRRSGRSSPSPPRRATSSASSTGGRRSRSCATRSRPCRRPSARSSAAACCSASSSRAASRTSPTTSSCAGCSARTPRRARWPSARSSRTGPSCACTPATPPAPTATCATRWSCAGPPSAARRPRARSSSRATGAGAGCSAPPTTTRPPSSTSWAAPRRPGSSPPARSGPSAARPWLHGFTATVAVFPA